MSEAEAFPMPPYRLVARLSGTFKEPRVKHYQGLPPELTEGEDLRQQMASAHLVVIETKGDGIFLYRYTKSGECVGDTWHFTVEDAKAQAAFEFEGLLSTWVVIPEDVQNPVSFGLTIPH